MREFSEASLSAGRSNRRVELQSRQRRQRVPIQNPSLRRRETPATTPRAFRTTRPCLLRTHNARLDRQSFSPASSARAPALDAVIDLPFAWSRLHRSPVAGCVARDTPRRCPSTTSPMRVETGSSPTIPQVRRRNRRLLPSKGFLIARYVTCRFRCVRWVARGPARSNEFPLLVSPEWSDCAYNYTFTVFGAVTFL